MEGAREYWGGKSFSIILGFQNKGFWPIDFVPRTVGFILRIQSLSFLGELRRCKGFLWSSMGGCHLEEVYRLKYG